MFLTPTSLRVAAASVALALGAGAASLALAQTTPAGPDAQHPAPMHMRDHGPRGGHGGPGPMGFGGPREMQRLLDSVNATEAQRAQIRTLMSNAQPDMRTQREAAGALREEQLKLLTQPTLDAAAVEAVRQKMLAQHDQASKRQLALLLEVSAVLTPEQRAKVATQMDSMRMRHGRHDQERRAAPPKSTS